MLHKAAGLAATFLSFACLAQLVPADPDWREAEAPPPPPLHTSHLVALDMPGSTLRFGVDPGSVAIGGDGIVRYVVVATSGSGAVNAMYEGIRCDTANYRIYARYTGTGWSPAQGDWRPMQDDAVSRHTLAIARNGACIGKAPNSSAEQIVRDLKASPDRRFRPEAR